MPDATKLNEHGVIAIYDKPTHGRYLHYDQTPKCCIGCGRRDSVDTDEDSGVWLNYCTVGMILPTKSQTCKRRK